MAERPLFIDPHHVARFEMSKVGTLVSDRCMAVRPARCPDTPVPPGPGWWRWHRGDWVRRDDGQPLEELPKLVRPSLPSTRDPGVEVAETPWLVRGEDWTRLVLQVGDRSAPVDVDCWDGWRAYLDATFGLSAWQARQTDRNKPVSFWARGRWLGFLLPVHDAFLPESAPPLHARGRSHVLAVPDPPDRRDQR